MRWNCPHCSVALAISDDKIGTGWSFSRCYKCEGFALIRRADVNLVKVDQAPSSPSMLAQAPPSTGDITHGLGAVSAGPPRPVIMPSRRLDAIFPPRFSKPKPTFESELTRTLENAPPAIETQPISASQMDGPTSEQDFVANSVTLPSIFDEEACSFSADLASPSESEYAPFRSRRRVVAPLLISIAAVVAVVSGVNLYLQGRNFAQAARETLVLPKAISSMNLAKVDTKQLGIIEHMHSDSVAQTAMAPVRDTSSITREPGEASLTVAPSMWIQPRIANASLRSGPGTDYTVVSLANPAETYRVLDWNARWFQVSLSIPIGDATTAWIRNDLARPATH